uniref:Sperm flagellar 2 n=1 Tax=Anser cygnoides TaxID=8845 RepID=A0A8B9DQ18_ANSCY
MLFFLGKINNLVPGSFAEEFSNGYLLGELLHKYGLQDDFNKFSQSRIASAKLNNFSLLEPTLHLLDVQFNENVAQDIMMGQHGAATKLLYELYIALEKKRKTKLTAVAMEAMRPTAPARLKSIGSVLYQERLKSLTPRQADLQLQQVSEHFEMKSKAMEDKIARIHISEQQKVQKLREEQRAQDIEKHRIGRRRQNEIMARIQAAIIQVPKPRPNHTIKAIEAQKLLKKKREAEDTYKEINKFEKSIAGNLSAKLQVPTLETTAQTATELLNIYSDDEYVRKIQKRLEEDMFAREQREKRRRKMLVEQLIAHEAQEEAYREEQLIYRLMRQSQQERRIAVQLMHVRHEKEVLRQNRIYREKQYEDRRLKEFQKALDREAALAKQEKIDCEEQTIKERERHEKIAVGRAQARYKKHYSICWEVIDQIIDLSTKVGEYRILTNNKIPLKLMCDWKEFFFNGKPIYEQASVQPLPNERSPEQLLEMNKMNLLDEKDYGEYKSMTGEWCLTEDNSEYKPPRNNNILGHVLRRLMEIFYPPKPKSSLPVFPSFPIKGCILGKLFSGKTTCVKFLEKVCNIQVLSVDTLVQKAIQAFLKNEMKCEHSVISQEAENSVKQNEVSIFINFCFGYHREKRVTCKEKILFNCQCHEHSEHFSLTCSFNCTLPQLSVRAQLGAASQKLLKKGKSIPDELLVAILLEAINQTPPEMGWILDGFPMTINQAKLFEKAYTGVDPDEAQAEDMNPGKLSLVTDPRAPNKPPVSLPAFDVSVLLDISDTTVLKRMATQKLNSSQMEQEDNNQNSDAEILEEKIDLVRDQVLHRISGFLDTWPKLENWFSVHHNILVKVNAETEESLVCEAVKEILVGEIAKKQNRSKLFCSAQEKSPGKKPLPVTSQDLVPPIPVTQPPIEPGSHGWIYVDEPLPKEISDFLVPYWENIENAYVNTIKAILRCLRDEQHSIIYYLADVRKNFQDYLKRPDLKQEFVSQWQSDFNSIADDLREDEETKAELHQRVTDLRDLLWDICDKRREEAEQERTDIMNDGWLLDHKGLAINHFFSLMQVEVDRFQDTKRLLHDYYRAMEGKIPTDDSQDFTRLPLIPLVSSKLPLPETNTAKLKNRGTLLKSVKDENSSENVAAAFGKDENLISDTWQTAVTAVSDMVRNCHFSFQKMRHTQLPSKSKDCEGDYFSAGLPSTVPVVEVSPVPLTSEELKKQELTLKIQQEYFAALKHEEEATKSRLELIKEKALAYIEELTVKAEEAYKDMEKWLGARFLAEMSSVEKLIEIGRHHIECSSKIQYEMTLEETDFFLSSDVKVIPDPVPSPHVPQVETSESGTLTISQLNTFHKQFLQVAPKGFIYKKVFIDIFIDLINLNLGTNYLPDAWMNLTLPDLQNLTSAFTVNSELIDWRRFLLAAAQPWPVPSLTQLLKTLRIFKSIDVGGSGLVTQERYMQVGLWFTGNEDLNSTKGCTEPLPFDRLGHLIKFFFSLFADTRQDPALFNYTEMLLYFAAHSDPVEGVYRALSIAAGTYIHRKEESSLVSGEGTRIGVVYSEEEKAFPYIDVVTNEGPLIEDESEVLNYTGEGKISLATLLKVFHDGACTDEDNHRFSSSEKEGRYDKHFIKIYKELDAEDLTPIPVEFLLKHPFIQDLINGYQEYKLIVSIAFRDHKLCKYAYRNLHYPRNVFDLDTVNLKCR